MVLKLRSPAIAPSGTIPEKYTCDGADLSPPLRWTDPPSHTQSFALIVESSGEARVHWLLYGVAGALRELPEGIPARDTVEHIGVQGINGFGQVGYGGPSPPPSSIPNSFFTPSPPPPPVAFPPPSPNAHLHT